MGTPFGNAGQHNDGSNQDNQGNYGDSQFDDKGFHSLPPCSARSNFIERITGSVPKPMNGCINAI
jgi:hypothetical protein